MDNKDVIINVVPKPVVPKRMRYHRIYSMFHGTRATTTTVDKIIDFFYLQPWLKLNHNFSTIY